MIVVINVVVIDGQPGSSFLTDGPYATSTVWDVPAPLPRSPDAGKLLHAIDRIFN